MAMVGWPVVASNFCWFTSVYFWIGRFLFNFSFARLLRHHLPSCSEQQIAADVATWLLYYILHALHQLTISPSGIAATRADMSLRMSVPPSIRLPRRSCRVKMAWYELHREYLWWFLDSFAFGFSAFFLQYFVWTSWWWWCTTVVAASFSPPTKYYLQVLHTGDSWREDWTDGRTYANVELGCSAPLLINEINKRISSFTNIFSYLESKVLLAGGQSGWQVGLAGSLGWIDGWFLRLLPIVPL